MSAVVVLCEDPYIPFPDPVQTLRLPGVVSVCPNLDVSAASAAEVADMLTFWFPRFKDHEQAIGELEWQEYVDIHVRMREAVSYSYVIAFAQAYVYRMVRARVPVEDGRDLPFDATCFEKVAREVGWFRTPRF
jgi:hypothetical protein